MAGTFLLGRVKGGFPVPLTGGNEVQVLGVRGGFAHGRTQLGEVPAGTVKTQ